MITGISHQGALAELYARVCQSGASLISYIEQLLGCRAAALKFYTPKERLQLLQRNSPDAAHFGMPGSSEKTDLISKEATASPFLFIDNGLYLYISAIGLANAYLQVKYTDAKMALDAVNRPGFNQIIPHIKQALRMKLRMTRQEKAQSAIHHVLDNYPIPMLAVDNQWRLVFENKAARALANFSAIGQSEFCKDSISHVNLMRIAGIDVSVALDKKMRKALEIRLGGEEKNVAVLQVPVGEKFQQVVICPSPIPGMFQHYTRDHWVWIYYLNIECLAALKLNQRLQDMHLTPTEIELAFMLLVGDSIQTIASHRTVSEQTVRKQIRSIFRKTGCDSQESLIIFLFERVIKYGI